MSKLCEIAQPFLISSTLERLINLDSKIPIIPNIVNIINNNDSSWKDQQTASNILERAFTIKEFVYDTLYYPIISMILSKCNGNEIDNNTLPSMCNINKKLNNCDSTFNQSRLPLKHEEFTEIFYNLILNETIPENRKWLRNFLPLVLQFLLALFLTSIDNVINIAIKDVANMYTNFFLALLDSEDLSVYLIAYDSIKNSYKHTLIYPEVKNFTFINNFNELFPDFDSKILACQLNTLNNDEKNKMFELLLPLKDQLLRRIDNKVILKELDSSTHMLRVAQCLLVLMQMSPHAEYLALKEKWLKKILDCLWYTDDELVKISTTELIASDIIYNPTCLKSMWMNSTYDDFIDGLSNAAFYQPVKLLTAIFYANMVRYIPEAREQLLKVHSKFASILADIVCQNDRTPTYEIVHIIVSIGESLNEVGIEFLNEIFPFWNLELYKLSHFVPYHAELLYNCLEAYYKILNITSISTKNKETLMIADRLIKDVCEIIFEIIFKHTNEYGAYETTYKLLILITEVYNSSEPLIFATKYPNYFSFLYMADDSISLKYLKQKFAKAMIAQLSQKLELLENKKYKQALDKLSSYIKNPDQYQLSKFSCTIIYF